MKTFSDNLHKRIQNRALITNVQVTPPATGKPRQTYASVVTHTGPYGDKHNLQYAELITTKPTPTHITQPSTLIQSQTIESLVAEMNSKK